MSCNQKDIKLLNVPQPTWESDRKTESFFQTERQLTDRLSMTSSPPAKLQTKAICDNQTQYTSQFQLPAKIPLFSLLPPELLKPGALTAELRCSLFFVAVDAEHAKHSFSVHNLKIEDTNSPGGIEPASDFSVYTESNLRSAGFYLQHASSGESRLICEDFSISAPAADRRELILREFKFPDFLTRRADQKCRLIVIEEKRVTMISMLYPFHFTSGLNIETRVQKNIRLAAIGAPLYSVKMTNTSDRALRLRWPKANSNRFVLFFRHDLINFPRPVCPRSNIAKVPLMGRLDLEQKQDLNWLETPDYLQFEIPANSTASGSLIVYSSTVTFNNPTKVRLSKPMEIWSYLGDEWLPIERLNWSISEEPSWGGPLDLPASCDD
jgi:hypothetical protein